MTTAGTAELVGRENFNTWLLEVQRDIAVVGYVGNTSGTRAFLGSDQNHAIGTTRSIDGGTAGILQYGNRLHILRSDVTQVAAGNTVNHYQWPVAGRQRTSTTHLDVAHGVGVGISRCSHVKASHLTGYQRHGVRGGSLVELILADLYHRARNLFLGH